jgi:hypothetical protein
VVSAAPPVPFQTHSAKFKDVDRLTSSAGIASVISQRARDGRFTFAIFRTYPRAEDGGTIVEEKTAFFPEDMADAYIEHIRLTMERIEQLKRSPESLPFDIRANHR